MSRSRDIDKIERLGGEESESQTDNEGIRENLNTDAATSAAGNSSKHGKLLT